MENRTKPRYLTIALAIVVPLMLVAVCAVIFGVIYQFSAYTEEIERKLADEADELLTYRPDLSPPVKSLEYLVDLDEIKQLSGKLNIKSLLDTDPAAAAIRVPENTSEVFRNAVRIFTEEPTINVVMRVPNKRLPGSLAMDMSPKGDLIYVVDQENKIAIIEVATKKVKARFDSPIPNTYAVLIDKDDKFFFVANENHIAKVDVESKQQIGDPLAISTALNDWQRAAKSNALAGVTKEGQLLAIADDFQKVEVLADLQVGGQVAIHPEGKYVLGYDKQNLLRWHHQDQQRGLERLDTTSTHFDYIPSVSCEYADCWFSLMGMHQWEGGKYIKWTNSYMASHPPMLISLRTMTAARTTEDRPNSMTIIGQVRNRDEPFQAVLGSFSMMGSSIQMSQMLPIDAEIVTRMKLDKSGNRIAILTEDELQIIDRTFVDDFLSNEAPRTLAKSVYTNDLEAVLDIVEQIRQRDWPNRCMTGEAFYGVFADRLAVEIAYLEENPHDESIADAKKAINDLRANGNVPMILASAMHHIDVGLEARGQGMSVTVSDEAWRTLDLRVRKAGVELETICASQRPPAYAFNAKLQSLLYGDGSLQDCVPYIKRCIELYPNHMSIHSSMCQFLLPRWGGAPGAASVYASEIASIYPKELQDEVYALILLRYIGGIRESFIHEAPELNADIDRIYLGALSLRDKGQLSREYCEALMKLAMELPSDDMIEDFGDYFLGKYMFCSWNAHQTLARDALAVRKYYWLIPPEKRGTFSVPESMIMKKR